MEESFEEDGNVQSSPMFEMSPEMSLDAETPVFR
jgi:hypothetical protein